MKNDSMHLFNYEVYYERSLARRLKYLSLRTRNVLPALVRSKVLGPLSPRGTSASIRPLEAGNACLVEQLQAAIVMDDCERLFRVQLSSANKMAVACFRKVRLKERELANIKARKDQIIRKKNREIEDLKTQIKALRDELEVKDGEHSACVTEMDEKIRSLEMTKRMAENSLPTVPADKTPGTPPAEDIELSPLTPAPKKGNTAKRKIVMEEASEASRSAEEIESPARKKRKIVEDWQSDDESVEIHAKTSVKEESCKDIETDSTNEATAKDLSTEDVFPAAEQNGLSRKTTFLEQCVSQFEEIQERKRIKLNQMFNELSLEGYTRELYINSLKIQFGKLFKCSSEDELNSVATQLMQDGYSSDHESLLFAFVFEQLKKERDCEFRDRDWSYSDDVFRSGWAHPRLTEMQMKVFSLLVSLEDGGMAGLTDRMSEYLFHSILGAKRLEEMRLYEAVSLTRFYFALLRMKGNDERIRTFLFDVAFFGSPRKHVFLCVLLEVWPQVLRWPAKGRPKSTEIDPVLEVYAWMVFNTGPPLSMVDMKVPAARHLLRVKCKICSAEESAVELVKRQIDLACSNIEDDGVCASTTLGLFLLSKCQDHKWSYCNIVDRLLVLRKHNSQSLPLLTWIVETTGLIGRTYPASGRKELLDLFTPMAHFLTASAPTPKIEEAFIRALIRVGHHLQVQVADFLWGWSPRFSLDSELVVHYVGTRGAKHARATIEHHKRWPRKELMRQLMGRKTESNPNK